MSRQADPNMSAGIGEVAGRQVAFNRATAGEVSACVSADKVI